MDDYGSSFYEFTPTIRTQSASKFSDINSEFKDYQDVFKNFEENTGVTINDQFIKQTFYPYIQENYFSSYALLIQASKANPLFASEITYLTNLLYELSEKHDLPLKNMKTIILALHNALLIENRGPNTGFIVYDQLGYFVQTIEKEFPSFYKDLYHGITEYRALMQAPLTVKGNHFLIYVVFIYWSKIMPNLRKKYETIKTLVISDCHVSHANLLEDFLNYEFPKQLKTEIFLDASLNRGLLEQLPHDLIITNFPFPTPKNKELVYIKNVPTSEDSSRIETAINKILSNRKLM